MPNKLPHYGDQIPEEEFRRDLYPNPYGGQNVGVASEAAYDDATSAYDLKPANRALQDFEDDELKQVPILRAGTRLEQGAVYVDLHDPNRREFKALGSMSAERGQWLVPKSAVDYVLWNRLIGVTDPERLNQADEQ